MKIYQILLLIFCGVNSIQSQISIPEALRECYTNNTVWGVHLPMNLRVLVDLIRKAERSSYTSMDMRLLSSSLLHRFRFDGIQYFDDIEAKEGILPFGATGSQRIKHRLIEELVPSNALMFPSENLTLTERCTLHHMLSSTIMTYHSQNARKSCQHIGQTEKITGRTVLAEGGWDCPREYGVILTPYSTISPGAVVAAIAASLQHQNIAIEQLLATFASTYANEVTVGPTTDMYNEDEIDIIVPKDQMSRERSMWHQSLLALSVKLDNVWLSTIAGKSNSTLYDGLQLKDINVHTYSVNEGDLAEMVVYQGPVLGSEMNLGETGFWNNTMRPGIYYLVTKHKSFDATRAEIVGGIDGLILANHLQQWVNSFHNLRLSQVLDMYYSEDGMSFDPNIKACERRNQFSFVAPKTLLDEQTYAVSHILAYRKSIAYMSSDAFKRMVDYATDKFSTYTSNYLFTESQCDRKKHHARVSAMVAFDGAWSKDYTTDFIAALIDDLDVSVYGSEMGIIHGSSGEWLLNVTSSPSSAYHVVSHFTEISWPSKLNFVKVLETVGTYLNETWARNRNNHMIGTIGQAVILLVPLGQQSEEELQDALALLKQIKRHHPDVHFLYYASKYSSHLLKPFILSEEDHLLKNSAIDDIIRHLSTVPRSLRPFIEFDPFSKTQNQIEEYVDPFRSIIYRLHPRWKLNTRRIIVSVHSVGYGDMKVCSWNQLAINAKIEGFYCKETAGHGEITLTDYSICTDKTPCPSTYYRVQNVTSLKKCTEIDCKTPHQVRYIIRMQRLYHKNSASSNISLVLTLCLVHLTVLLNA